MIGFRKEQARIASVAETIGWDVDEYISQIIADATSNGVAVPWAVSVDWQMERSMYEIRLPRTGWWAQIDHADSLAALEVLAPAVPGLSERLRLLTAGAVTGDEREITTLAACFARRLRVRRLGEMRTR